MDFDREYRRPGQHMTPDDFTDSNVQALVEGRRTKPLPTPNVRVVDYYVNDTPPPGRRETADLMQRLAQGLSIKPGRI